MYSSENNDEEIQPLQTKFIDYAPTLADKRDCLHALDKLLRGKKDRQTDLATAVAIIGTCPDMCPEFERYFRIVTNQLSPFELDSNGVPDENRMVKEYRRSGADQQEPLPHELRPINVLQRTMTYLCLEIIDQYNTYSNIGEWFDFVWSRTRSIRKDITQQHLIDLNSVDLISKCARFHIFCSYQLCEEEIKDFDPKINEENLSNCLQTLKDFYYDLNNRSIRCENEPEFRAYDILLNLRNGETLSELKHFSQDVKRSPEVRFAVKVYHAFYSQNYIRFFRLARQANFFMSCILNRYFNYFRIDMLNIMRLAYTNSKSSGGIPYSTDNIINYFAFDDFQELSYFCDYVGLKYDRTNIYFNRNFSIESVHIRKRSHSLVLVKLGITVGQAILGSSSTSVEKISVHSSFDNNHKLIANSNILKLIKATSKDLDLNNDSNISSFTFSAQKLTEKSFFQSSENKNIQPLPSSLSKPPSFPSSLEKNTFAGSFFKTPNETFQNDSFKMLSNHLEKPIFRITSPVKENFVKQTEEKVMFLDFTNFSESFFQNILSDIIKNLCQNSLKNALQKNIISKYSESFFNSLTSHIIIENLENFCEQQQIKQIVAKISSDFWNDIVSKALRSIICEIYYDLKMQSLKKNIFFYSKNFFNKISDCILIDLVQETLAIETKHQNEKISLWRKQFLKRKFWLKWRLHYKNRKKYLFYRDTFPAAPPSSKLLNYDPNEDFQTNFLLNRVTLIDDEFIESSNLLKRKLIYSHYENVYFQSLSNSQQSNGKISRKKFFDSDSRELSKLEIERVEHTYFLQKKYFKLWFRKVHQIKANFIRLRFPSAPVLKTYSETLDSNEHHTLTSRTATHHHLSIIDAKIQEASSSIQRNLLRKLNYDFDLTVEMVQRTLDECRKHS